MDVVRVELPSKSRFVGVELSEVLPEYEIAMNAKQLKVVWVTAGAVALLAINPPWQDVDRSWKTDEGYSLITSPPTEQSVIDVSRLAVSIVAVSVIGGALFLTFKDKGNQPNARALECPACSKPSAPGAKFCNGCGGKLV